MVKVGSEVRENSEKLKGDGIVIGCCFVYRVSTE